MCEEDGNVDWDFPALDQVGLYLLYVLCTVQFCFVLRFVKIG